MALVTNSIKGWDLTIPNMNDPIAPMVMQVNLAKIFKSGWFQLEKGELTGHIHYQVRGILHTKTRIPQKLHPGHWSPTTKQNLNNYKYVTKDHTNIDGPWEITTEIDYVIQGIELKNWQQQLKDKLIGHDKRHIHVVIDPIGNNGKSTFRDVMVRRFGAIPLPILNDATKLIETACSLYQSRTPDVLIFDMPRTSTHGKAMWQAIETIKGGTLIDTRYKFNMVLIKKLPHIVVLTNHEPPLSALSADRWILWGLRKDIGQDLPTLITYDQNKS